jgi:hypothetical protein
MFWEIIGSSVDDMGGVRVVEKGVDCCQGDSWKPDLCNAPSGVLVSPTWMREVT